MTTHNTPDSKQEAPHGETTRVKERLNLHYHGMKECEKPTMFREVREWLREMDDAGAESLHALICGVVHRHCAGIQLPHGTNGLENDLIEALVSRASAVEGDAQIDPVNTYPTVVESVQLLEAAGFGAPGKPNTLLAMVKEAIAAVSSPTPAEPPKTCGPPVDTDCSECAYEACPRRRDGCSEYCWQHHKTQCEHLQPTGEQERQVQCADCQAWFNPDTNHTCRQQVRRNQRSAKQ